MKTIKIMTITALLVVLAAGCGKDNEKQSLLDDGHLHLFTENMGNNGTKILIDPANINGATWVANEHINLNGTPYVIVGDNDNDYYLDGVSPLTVDMYAVYPATINEGGNHIDASNDGAAACAVNIHSLCVEFVGNGGNAQKVYFPMAAKAAAGSHSLGFRHLTGGIRLTLKNNGTYTDLDVARLVVSATTADGKPAIYKDLYPTEDGWNPRLLPGMPSGEIGIEGDQNVQFIADMTLYLKEGSYDYKTIASNGGEITFCMPMLAKEFKTLTIKGYSPSGTEIFSKTKILETAIAIERNKMYNIPVIAL